MLERWFQLRRHGVRASSEVRAGVVTFLTMSYILAVNPQILGTTGMPAEDVVAATALSAAIATLVMGLYARLPLALAPGMGLNAYFAFGVVAGLGVSWQVALAAVFVEGLLFLALSLAGLRGRFLAAVPRSIQLATAGGIGLFLGLIGLTSAGIVVDHPATLVQLGDLRSPAVALAAVGIVVAAALVVRRVPGGLLLAIVSLAAVAWGLDLAPRPMQLLHVPRLPAETLFALDFAGLLEASMISVVLAFLVVDLLDTAGTLLGVGHLAGLIDERGEMAGADRAFTADAVGTSVGALLGTSTVTTYVESATGIQAGGRTGLVAVTVAALFLVAMVFTPVFVAIPALATAPALVVVGAAMAASLRQVPWDRLDEALPAFLTATVMPFTYSIGNGLAAGIVSWVALKLLAGRRSEVHPGMAVLALLLVAYYGLVFAG